MNITSLTPLPQIDAQIEIKRSTSADTITPSPATGSISHITIHTASIMAQQRKFTNFHAEATRLRKAAIFFKNDSNPEVRALLKESCDKIESLEKTILNDMSIKREMNKPALEAWQKISEAFLQNYRQIIIDGMKQVQADWEDCLGAYKIIDGVIIGESDIIRSQKQAQDKWFKCIEQSLQNRAKDLKLIVEKLHQDAESARRSFQNLTAQKIEGIKQCLDAINPQGPLCTEPKNFLFAGVMTGQNPNEPISPYPLMAALQTKRNLQVISSKEMKPLLVETNYRKNFFKQEQLLRIGFSSKTNTMTLIAKQFLTAKDELAACRATLERQLFAPEKKPLKLSATTDQLNVVQQKAELLSLSPPLARNVAMPPRPEPSPPDPSPDLMTVSPPSPVFDEEKSPGPILFVSSSSMPVIVSPQGQKQVPMNLPINQFSPK